MSGTFRKDRPWIHLLFSEKMMMRVHSVYHNKNVLHEKYSDLEGGLNKMTLKKAKSIVNNNSNLELVDLKVTHVWGINFFRHVPVLNELFTGGVYMEIKKNNSRM